MARGSHSEMSLWKRRPLIIPPNSIHAWMQLAIWEMWMGILFCCALGVGVTLIVTSPDHIVAISDFRACYGPPPVPLPCERIVYRGGLLYMGFTALCGVMLVGASLWFLWELWTAVEPKPVTDDFLKLLNDSFGRDWRNPFTWPWGRVVWAYGFTTVGAALIAGVAVVIWSVMAASTPVRTPAVHVETSQPYMIGTESTK
jgi:hypothetical protein